VASEQQGYPFIVSGTVSPEANTALNEASGSGIIAMSRIVRSALDLWLAQHRWLMQQGFSPLDATKYLLEAKAAQSQAAPPQFPSPFQAPNMNGAPHVRP
jgi:hypothetical protein